MAALAFLTTGEALAAAPALSMAVPERPAMDSDDMTISAAVFAERSEAAVTAFKMVLSVNTFSRLAGGALARLAGGALFLLPPPATAPDGADGIGGRAAVEEDAPGGARDEGVDGRRRGGGCRGPDMATSGEPSADEAAAGGGADVHEDVRGVPGLCANGSVDESVRLGGVKGCPLPPSGPTSAEAGAPVWLMRYPPTSLATPLRRPPSSM